MATISKRASVPAASPGLSKLIAESPAAGTYGISHTRWATHGKPTDQNAHPHFDESGKLALVHNGVIENYQQIKDALLREGEHHFTSETDTEVLAHWWANSTTIPPSA